MTPSDDPNDVDPEVLLDILMDQEGNMYALDEDAMTRPGTAEDGSPVDYVFTPDFFGCVDANGLVWTPNGTPTLEVAPTYT